MNHLPIIYQDEDILVINKEAGLICHPVGYSQGDTVISRISAIMNINAHLVHRLDQRTTGVLLLAKTPQVAKKIYFQFQRKLIRKTYLALVKGIFVDNNLSVSNRIEKRKDSLIKIQMDITNGESNAISHYKCIKRFEQNSLLKVRIETGKKHQIRLQLANLGYPIIGENLYDKAGLEFLEKYYLHQNPSFSWHGLHAHSLEIQHPKTREKVVFSAKMPEKWLNWMK